MITPPERRCAGFAIVSALFIIVALAALGAFIAVVSGGQQIGSAYDLNGARAYYAARSGAEWGAGLALGAGLQRALYGALFVLSAGLLPLPAA